MKGDLSTNDISKPNRVGNNTERIPQHDTCYFTKSLEWEKPHLYVKFSFTITIVHTFTSNLIFDRRSTIERVHVLKILSPKHIHYFAHADLPTA